MSAVQELFEAAMDRHRAGNLSQAEELYRRLLAVQPDHPGAHHLLGVLAIQCGHVDAAIDSIAHAIDLQPSIAEFHCNLGVALEKRGQWDAAQASYRRALSLRPAYPEACNNLGMLLTKEAKFDEALAYLRQALQLKPNYPDALSNMGDVLKAMGSFEASVDCYQLAIQAQPDFVNAYNNLGIAWMEQGCYETALKAYRHAISLQPDFADAYNNIGNVLIKLEKLEAARTAYQRAIELSPSNGNAYRNLGIALRLLGQTTSAKAMLQSALALNPDDAEAMVLLVDILQHTCEWDGLLELSARIVTLVEKNDLLHPSAFVSPFTFLTLPTSTSAKQQWRCATQWGRSILAPPMPLRPRDFTPARRAKMRIGYLSADLRTHAVGYIIPELFEGHDRTRFEVFGYSIGNDDASPIRQRIAEACFQFRDLQGLPFQEAARQIAADEVDILVDLQGHTQLARTQILAHRPAPIQVNYLGYPGTMGVDFIDYILVDNYIVPSWLQPYFSERLVHLPGCYLVNDSRREFAAGNPSPSDVGLPSQAFVFCAFGSAYKLTSRMFDVWLRLLSQVPASVLWLRVDNESARDNLRRRAAGGGIESERLVFAPAVSMPEHLARHSMADLFLDTYPYNQHSTASDALRAGLPLLTLSGQTFASRVAGSLLHHLGMDELIADSIEAYEAKALRLAQHPDELSNLRQRLAESLKTTTLFDGKNFAKGVEQAYQKMWEIYRSGEAPRPFSIE